MANSMYGLATWTQPSVVFGSAGRLQAERDGRAVIRIDGKRYERQLVRITSGDILDGISAVIRNKYPSQTTRASVEAGEDWVFEAAPRNSF